MVAIPLISGIKGSQSGEFKRSYPLNLEPVPIDSKISKGQLRLAAGATQTAIGLGLDRGGILWNSKCYRVMGTQLVSVEQNGSVTNLGGVGEGGPVSMDFGFDRLAINSGDRLYYYNINSLTPVTDPDLGPVKDMLWVSGFYMTTDGTSIVVTELSDPMSVLPLKYGSAEEDPDQITGLIKVRGEVYVLGTNTIQVMELVGGNGFPFAPVRGATIPYGCVSASAKCPFGETFAFVGSARNEGLGVYIAGQGTAEKVSTREIDDALAAERDATSIILECRTYRDETRLVMHLAGESWAFLGNASKSVGEYVWYRLTSGMGKPYRIRNAVLAYGRWIVGDTETAAVGNLDESTTAHFGEETEWQFDAGLIYNGAKGGIVKSVELVGLSGRVNGNPSAFLSVTQDGETYSLERELTLARERVQWRPMMRFRAWMGLRIRGYGGAFPGIAALEADIEPLAL